MQGADNVRMTAKQQANIDKKRSRGVAFGTSSNSAEAYSLDDDIDIDEDQAMVAQIVSDDEEQPCSNPRSFPCPIYVSSTRSTMLNGHISKLWHHCRYQSLEPPAFTLHSVGPALLSDRANVKLTADILVPGTVRAGHKLPPKQYPKPKVPLSYSGLHKFVAPVHGELHFP